MSRWIALAILTVFYAVYFLKLLCQHCRGIRTHQIGVGNKPSSVRAIERLLSFSTCSVVLVELFFLFLTDGTENFPVLVVGVVLGIAGDLLFAISVFTMRDSWRAGIPAEGKTELITDGIYRFSRNPAFLGFDLIYFSILLICFHPILLLFTLLAVLSLHLQILQEERYLTVSFGASYQNYCRKTFRYFGRKRDITAK